MADMNRGLDLSVFETATDAESDQFRSFYRDKLGGMWLPGNTLDPAWTGFPTPYELPRLGALEPLVRRPGPGGILPIQHSEEEAHPGGGGTLGPAVTFGHVAGKSVLAGSGLLEGRS